MSEASNVVPLPGYSAPSTEPVKEVVEILEEALDKARQGRIIAVAMVTVERDPQANVFNYHAGQMSRHSLMAGALGLTWSLGKQAAEEDPA